MAAIDRFYIGQIDGQGLMSDLKPYAIPDNAFAELNNAYVFRGRVRKRFGSKLMRGTTAAISGLEQIQSRLKINIGTTDGAGNFIGVVPGSVFEIGQAFSVASNFFTVYQTGAPAAMYTTGPGTGTYNTTTGDVSIAGSNALSVVYFYPATPVMGLITFQKPTTNVEDVFAFDTQFAYQFTGNGWERLGTAVWTGDNADFFWGANWRGISAADTYIFVTNFVANDRLKYWDGSIWNTFSPVLTNTTRLLTGRIILPFKDHLLVLNTIENEEGSNIGTTDAVTGNFSGPAGVGPWSVGQNIVVGNVIFTVASAVAGPQPMIVNFPIVGGTPPTATFDVSTGAVVITGNNNNPLTAVFFLPNVGGTPLSFVNRCRFSLNGSPVSSSSVPNATNSFFEYPGLGGYIDAPTKEAIITAQFLKDRLIVYFESSTWELVYTGNQILPFVWQQINTELGAESTFSQVPFDKVVLGVGNVGIHACNGSNVERIDEKIPDEVFNVHNDNNGVERVAGIRDYYTEMVYWTFPSQNRSTDFPFNNRILTYNYKNGNWAFNDDSITAFGYFQSVVAGTSTSPLWSEVNIPWSEAGFTWGSPTLQAKFRSVVAGNQEGYTFLIDPELFGNSPSLQITDFQYVSNFTATITAINHNLAVGDYVKIQNAQGITSLNGLIRQVTSITSADVFVLDIDGDTVIGTYTGGGTLAKVTPIDFKTKQYNFYGEQGSDAYVQKVDFFVDRTESGQCTVDFYVSSSDYGMLTQAALTGSLVGTSVLETSPYLFTQSVGTTDISGNATGSAPLDYAQVGNTFLIGNQVFLIVVDNGALSTTGSGSGTLNTLTGAYTFTGAAIDSDIIIRKPAIPIEQQQTRLWHPLYFFAEGETVQFRFYLSDSQIKDHQMSEVDFQLHAFICYATPTSSRI